ncbi:hypothetical protein [Metabacillus fastidiosus]|uniref:hypothetical protein n=1 Tax=Metabacillus fastidiosus TaxID=1458 RepID=UPI003D28E07E
MKEIINKFEKEFDTELTERENMIFKYAFRKGLSQNDKEKVETLNIRVVQHQGDAVKSFAKNMEEAFGVSCKANFLTMVFPFYKVYQVIIKGKQIEVDEVVSQFNKSF